MKLLRKLKKQQWLTKQWAQGNWVVFPDLGEWQAKIINKYKHAKLVI